MKNYNNFAYLLFKRSKHVFAPFLKKGFEHIDILVTSPPSDYFTFIFPSGNRILFAQIAINEVDKLWKRYNAVLQISFTEHSKKTINLSFPHTMNCVSVAKYALGINSPVILTPFRLYKYLTNQKKISKIPTIDYVTIIKGI